MKNTLFICKFLTILSLNSVTAFAQTPPIEEMDMGACWIQAIQFNQQQAGFRIASFGSGSAFTLLADEFTGSGGQMKEWVQKQLKTRFTNMPSLKYEVGFHCYSSGHTVSIQLDRPTQQPICINAKAIASNVVNELELIAIRPDAAYNEGSFCLGIEERSIGLSLKKSDDIQVTTIRELIAASPALSAIVESIDYRSGSFFAVAKLKEAYAFREVEAKAAIDANADIMERVSNTWLNSMNTIEGQSRVLFKGMTDAY